MEISTSILTCDFTKVEEDLKKIKEHQGKYLHLDIMDGYFVPSITFGAKFSKDLFQYKENLIFDAHLMVQDPYRSLDSYQGIVDYLTVHVESDNLVKSLEKIKTFAKPGIAFKPATSVDELKPYLPMVDLVLVMSVEPGAGGQAFMMSALDKVKELKRLREENNYSYLISIDGGINLETGKLAKEAGVDLAVSGSFVVKDYQNLSKLLEV